MATFSEIGRRLRVARTEEAISTDALSRATGVPKALIETVERGESGGISTAALARVAKHLGLTDTELWADEEPSGLALFFKHATVPDFFSEDSLVARDALRAAEAVQAIEDLVGRVAPLRDFFDAEPVGNPAFEDGYALARKVRRALHLKGLLPYEVAPLPPDWESIVEDSFGIPIVEQPLVTRSVLAFAAKLATPTLAAIVINTRSRSTALLRRVTVAHELSHAVFDPVTQQAGLFVDREGDLSESRGEQRARAFAAELLVPRAGLLALLGPPDPTIRGVESAARLVERAGSHFGSTIELTAHHLANHRYFAEALHEEIVRSVTPWEYPEAPAREPLLARRIKQGLDAGVLSEGRARELLGLGAWDALPGRGGGGGGGWSRAPMCSMLVL